MMSMCWWLGEGVRGEWRKTSRGIHACRGNFSSCLTFAVEKMRTVEHILLSPVCNTALERNFLKKPEDWKQVLEVR